MAHGAPGVEPHLERETTMSTTQSKHPSHESHHQAAAHHSAAAHHHLQAAHHHQMGEHDDAKKLRNGGAGAQ
jgi:gamma-glutamyl:cysteine ligase YbdK (ATP-grasp superfamily)